MGQALIVSLALAAVVGVVYAPVAGHGFVNFDDHIYLYTNPEVAHGLTWQSVSWAFKTGYAANWHPLTWLSHLLDVEMFGMNPGPHHVVSLLLHILNTVLLFWALLRMTGAAGRSAFVAAMFGLHPLHVQSVAWAAERKDVLSTAFWMLTLLAYRSYVLRPGLARYLSVALLFAFGLMAKPMLVTLPFTLLLLDYWPLERFRGSDGRSAWPRLLLEKVPLMALTVASSAITFAVQQRGGAVHGVDSLPVASRLANALVAYAAYIGKTLWPADLAVLYPLSRLVPSWWPLAAAALLGLCAATILGARRYPFLPVGWFWYLGTLVPVIGLVQVGDQSMADRYTYVPLIGLFIIAAWGVMESPWAAVRKAGPAVGVVLVTLSAALTRAELGHWRNSVALWEHAIAVTSGNFTAHNSLGLALQSQGMWDEAIVHYREAIRINPRYSEAQFNLGVALEAREKVDEAISHYREALRLKPDYGEAHNNLGIRLARQGHLEEAITHFHAAIEANPASPSARNNLANALREGGRRMEAIPSYREALRLNPNYVEARSNLAATLADERHFDESIKEYLEALRLKPDYAVAHTGLGLALANSGKPAEAIVHFKEALRLNPGDGTARQALGIVQQQVARPR